MFFKRPLKNLLYSAYLIMEPVHVLLGIESPLSLIMAVVEGEEEGVGRGVWGRERGAGR